MLERFLGGKVGKIIGKNTISLLLEQANKSSADSAEVALGFMEPEELENPEADSAG